MIDLLVFVMAFFMPNTLQKYKKCEYVNTFPHFSTIFFEERRLIG